MHIKLPFRKLAAAALFVTTDETRFVLTGVRIEPKPYGVLIIATDGRRIVFIRHEIQALDQTLKEPILIPAALINRLGIRTADEIIEDEEAGPERQPTEPPDRDCLVTVAGKDVTIRLDGEISHGVIGHLVEGLYPNTDKIIPRTRPDSYKVWCFNGGFMEAYRKAGHWLAPYAGAVVMAGHEQAEDTPHARVYSVRLNGCPDFYSAMMSVKLPDALELVAVPDWLKA